MAALASFGSSGGIFEVLADIVALAPELGNALHFRCQSRLQRVVVDPGLMQLSFNIENLGACTRELDFLALQRIFEFVDTAAELS